jgi:hypothetical protein
VLTTLRRVNTATTVHVRFGIVEVVMPDFADVRLGSKADMTVPPINVCFTLKSGHRVARLGMSALCQRRT